MVYVPHWRLTMIGVLPGPEIFSMSLALAKFDGSPVPGLAPNDVVWNDIADDCADWFGAGNTAISNRAQLRMVKVAPIGANGLYTGAPAERERIVNGGASGGFGQAYPNQVARAVTLHTAGDLSRVKGRFYVPLPGMPIGADGRWSASDVDLVEGFDQALINNINNQPGIDVLDIRVAVASQGRKNKDGSVRVGPANHMVTHVSVGRVPDTIRRRRNKLAEARTAVPVS